MRNVLQLKIALNHVQPPIWRRIQVADDATFHDLHQAIQATMGWDGGHLHEFSFEGKKSKMTVLIGPPSEESMFEVLPEAKELVKNWLPTKAKQCLYTYDFGDNWEHTVLFEKAVSAEPGVEYPQLVAGKRACPPEDCGGVGGYMRILEILKDPADEEHAESIEWMGEDFDPEAFDPSAVVFDARDTYEEGEVLENGAAEEERIESIQDAIQVLDHSVSGIPFAAIKYLRNADSSEELLRHLRYVLENAYTEQAMAADIFHDTSPLWYAIVAEEHLDECLIRPVVHLLTDTTGDWDFLNEQAQYLTCLLAEKYPDKVAGTAMKAMDAAMELNLHSPYLFLFDIFLVVDTKKYEKWLLAAMAHPNNPWRAPLAYLLADLRLKSAAPVLEKVIAEMRSGTRPNVRMELYDESNDIEEALKTIQGSKKPSALEQPKPEYKQRGDWEAHYRVVADRFDDKDDEPPLHKPDQNAGSPSKRKTGRNEPCPCGSGKKYKKCCGVS